jgi:hypothetical protein
MKVIALLFILFAPCAASAYPSLAVTNAALAYGQGGGEDAADRGFVEAVEAMAATLAVECYKNDEICAEYVSNVILWRRLLASDTAGVEFSVRQIVETPKQFSGLKLSPLLRDPVEMAVRMAFFRPIAADAINGGLDGKYPSMTHYARREAMPKTAWGRAALKKEKLIHSRDGHVFVVGPLPFRLPKGAVAANKLLSWNRCIEFNGDLMAEMFPSCREKTCRIAAR